MANQNKKVGNAFEQEFCEILAQHGFWAHNLAQNRQGQPFDVIAAKDGVAYVFDCKVCEDDVFDLSRIEENQENAMLLWESKGNIPGFFVFKMSSGYIKMVTFANLLKLRDLYHRKSLYLYHHSFVMIDFKEWMEYHT